MNFISVEDLGCFNDQLNVELKQPHLEATDYLYRTIMG